MLHGPRASQGMASIYQGNKQRAIKHIQPYIDNDGTCTGFLDVCAGSCTVLAAANGYDNYVAVELCPLLVTLYLHFQKGGAKAVDELPEISEQEYDDYKAESHDLNTDNLKKATAAYLYSYNGTPWKGYLSVSQNDDRDYLKTRRKHWRTLAQNKNFKKATILNNSYADIQMSEYKDYTVYCDPPYDGREGYYINERMEFNHPHFYETAREWRKHARRVLVSEGVGKEGPERNLRIVVGPFKLLMSKRRCECLYEVAAETPEVAAETPEAPVEESEAPVEEPESSVEGPTTPRTHGPRRTTPGGAERVSEALPGSPGRQLSRGPPPAAVCLEREVGTVLAVKWADGVTYEGSVKSFDKKRQQSLVHYPCDRKQVWHDFKKDGCSFGVVEPAAHTLSTLRRTEDGYNGQVSSRGEAAVYVMTPDYVEAHFRKRCNEGVWLDSLGAEFKTVPQGAKRRRVGESSSANPYCVLGSLAKALRHVGDTRAAERVEADCVASLKQPDRLRYAAGRDGQWGLEARKIKGGTNALEWRSEHPTLLQVSRTHVVAVCAGLLFDYTEPQPLPLTRANLDQCIGAPYVDQQSRGYVFHPNPKKRKL